MAVDEKNLFYEGIARNFDHVMHRYDLRRRIEIVFDHLLKGIDLQGKQVLDAGCGTGWFSRELVRRGAIVTALDVGPELLAEVKKKCHCKTVVGDLEALDFPNENFDIVVSSEVIEHLKHPMTGVKELMRVLKQHGILALTTPNHRWQWAEKIAHIFHLRPYHGYEHWVSWRDLEQCIKHQGGVIEQEMGFHALPPMGRVLQVVVRFLDRFQYFRKYMIGIALQARKIS